MKTGNILTTIAKTSYSIFTKCSRVCDLCVGETSNSVNSGRSDESLACYVCVNHITYIFTRLHNENLPFSNECIYLGRRIFEKKDLNSRLAKIEHLTLSANRTNTSHMIRSFFENVLRTLELLYSY